MRVLLLVLALLALAMPASAETLTWPPFDDAGQDPSFKAYRDRLLTAVEQRNVDAVLAASSPQIDVTFGGEPGREAFREMLTGHDNEFVWQTLERVLKEGGGFRDGLFQAPWTYLYVPPQNLDVYSVAIVAGKNVRLRKGPSTEAAVIRPLSYEVILLADYDPNRQDTVQDASGREWKLVKTLDGEEGWIASSYLRLLTDHRAGFEKTGDGWQMIFFVAGD